MEGGGVIVLRDMWAFSGPFLLLSGSELHWTGLPLSCLVVTSFKDTLASDHFALCLRVVISVPFRPSARTQRCCTIWAPGKTTKLFLLSVSSNSLWRG